MLSVVIPAYNEEENIAEAIEALFAQSYKDVEIIVVDNGSSDRTRDIVRGYPVHLIEEVRKGTMWACEAGRLAAKGDVIVRMDADCRPNPDWLSRGAAYFHDPRVAALSGPYDYFDADKSFRIFSGLAQAYIYPAVNFSMQKLGLGGVTIGGNTFIRKEVLEKMGGFDTSIAFYGDDTDVAKRAARFGKVVFDRKLVMPSSARRFGTEGRTKLATNYIKHFLKITFRKSRAM